MTYRVTIDYLNQQSLLDLYVSGVLVTSYSFVNGVVVLGARPDATTLTRAELSRNVIEIEQWSGAVKQMVDVEKHWVQRHLDIDVDAASVSVVLRFPPIGKMIDAKYVVAGHSITFQPRPQRQLTLDQFDEYLKVLQEFARLVSVG